MLLKRLVNFCALIAPLIAIPPALGQAPTPGYFRVERRDGVWWMINPEGNATLSIGVDQVAYIPDRIQGTGPAPYLEAVQKIYPDRNTWGLATLARLREWGFNTIGAWSDEEIWDRGVPYTVILDIASRAGADWLAGKPVDVYDRRFEKSARDLASLACAPRRNDHLLVGYFSDNELRWGPDWRGKQTMLQMYLEFPGSAEGRKHATVFLREHYANDAAKLGQAWGVEARDFDHPVFPQPGKETEAYKADSDAFLEQMASRYFEVCEKAIHEADPNHLFLGARFAGRVPDPVLRAAKICDVVSVNIYSMDPRPLASHINEVTGRPVLIGEFAFRAQDSGLPNTRGAGPKVADQKARAKAYADYVDWLVSLPGVVGYHWFKWADEPKEGRFDGENSNYGLVDIGDRPYDPFIETVKATNAGVLEKHKSAAAIAVNLLALPRVEEPK